MPWRIDDRLHVSGTPTLRTLDQTGATALVTVCRKEPPLEVRQQSQLLAWYHLPIQDGKTLQPELYDRAVEIVESLLNGGHTVLVNCLAGRNRSILIAGLVLQRRHDLSGREVLDQLRAIRSNCLHNPLMEEWLLNGERRTPAAWEKLLHVEILDPDGWDRKNFDESWSEPITRAEFERRAMASTVQTRGGFKGFT